MAKKKGPSDYDVGYGKPPSESQFKPGQSGNRSGRPKGSKSFEAHLRAELSRRVPITEGGKQRSMTKRQVIAVNVVNKAAGGDPKMIPMLAVIDREQQAAASTANSHLDLWDTPEDRLLLERARQRIISSETDSPTTEGNKTLNAGSDVTEGHNNV